MSNRSTRSLKCVRLCHSVKLLFFSGRYRNVQRFETHVQHHCSAHLLVAVAVADLVCS